MPDCRWQRGCRYEIPIQKLRDRHLQDIAECSEVFWVKQNCALTLAFRGEAEGETPVVYDVDFL